MNRDDKRLKMVQRSAASWYIETPKGMILTDDITVSSLYEAEEYVKRYVSSFLTWDYEMKPLIKQGENK